MSYKLLTRESRKKMFLSLFGSVSNERGWKRRQVVWSLVKKKNKIKLNENDPNIRFAGAISEFYI